MSGTPVAKDIVLADRRYPTVEQARTHRLAQSRQRPGPMRGLTSSVPTGPANDRRR